MTMAIDGAQLELYFSGYSSTTTTATISTENDHDRGGNWNGWSPMVDWEALSGPLDDFQDLIDSMMDDGALMNQSNRLTPDTSNSMSASGTVIVDEETSCGDDLKGLRLVHLLIAAAEALTGLNKNRDLARVILVRLKELVSPNDGTNMERLAAYFTDALQGLLEGTGGIHSNKHHSETNNGPYHHHHRDDPQQRHHQSDVLGAFQLLQDMSPYVKFGHFTANQAILEAVADDRRIHIVDYDIMEGIQWASLMQALVSRKGGRPTPHLRITALSRSGSSRRFIGTVQETGRRLVAFAASIGLPFSFHQCRLDSDETFRPSALKLVRGEALVMNCMLHLPHFSYRAPDSVTSFLSGAKTLNPRLLTMVEEEVGPIGDGGFVGRFMDSLHHYSAFYDSLEAGFPMQGLARGLVERVFWAPESQACPWGVWLAAGGFQPVKVSFANHCQAKLLLGVFNDGYRVEEVASNRLVLGWKSRRLLSASIWTSPSDPDL
ncbi:scarecrow transcription factor family protein [Salix suchowensis]|nr:scarecrow transcription factor family protein [Salix suchowensis]